VLGPVMVRDVAVLDLDHYAMTTDTYGSVVERLVDAITDGYGVYPRLLGDVLDRLPRRRLQQRPYIPPQRLLR